MAAETASEPSVALPAGSRLSRRGLLVLAAVIFVVNLPLVLRVFRGPQPTRVTVPYSDGFDDPATVTDHYFSTGGLWRVVGGELYSPGVKNNPLWLEASLPADVAIELDVRSQSPEGDIKVEVFGNGLDHASGYVLIHGGWGNSLSVIARLDEHGQSLDTLQIRAAQVARERQLGTQDLVETGVFEPKTRMRVEARPYPVELGRRYHWRIERRGHRLDWSIDGKPFMSFDDPFPLAGKGHDRFGFSSWDASLYFDNLKIEPL